MHPSIEFLSKNGMKRLRNKTSQWVTWVAVIGLLCMVSWHAVSRPSSQGQITVHIGERLFLVEVVDTSSLRERGLGGRSGLSSGHGMLFLFPDIGPDRHAFWMKGMRFPIDIAWIRDARVIHIDRNISADSKDIFRPPVIADSVLEVNAGELFSLVPGDTVSFSGQ